MLHRLLVLFLAAASVVHAASLRAGGFFADHMVLQRAHCIPVWGTADPGARVHVAIAGREGSATADAHGQWCVSLDSIPGSGPYDLVMTAGNTMTLADVTVGDLFLCLTDDLDTLQSPKSQVRRDLQSSIVRGGTYRAAAGNQDGNTTWQADWAACDTASGSSSESIACRFGAEIAGRTGVPVGILFVRKGSLAGMADVPPCMEGALWLRRTGTEDGAWKNRLGAIPAFAVTLPPGKRDTLEVPPTIGSTDAMPGVWQACTSDLEEGTPGANRKIAYRLALLVRAKVYHDSVEWSGPVFSRMRIAGGSAVVHMDHAREGLTTLNNAAPTGFWISGTNHVFYPAQVKLMSSSVIVSCLDVPSPVAVRYVWGAVNGNLGNRSMLAAPPFRTDNWTEAKKGTPHAKIVLKKGRSRHKHHAARKRKTRK